MKQNHLSQSSYITSTRDSKRLSRGFTLIEIVVALMIFGIWVIVLLRAVVYFIGVGDEVKKKAQATLLAKEAIDIIYNQRDTNLRRGVVWKCAIVDSNASMQAWAPAEACSTIFSPGEKFIAWFNGSTWYVIAKLWNNSDGTKLYTQTKNNIVVYTYDNQWTPTSFTREILIEQSTLQNPQLSSDQVVKVIVKVWYIPNKPDRVVTLETYLAAWERVQ